MGLRNGSGTDLKRLVYTVVGVLIIVPLVAIGCAEKGPTGLTPEEGKEIVSSCVTCHTDKDLLKEVATPEPEEKSEATSGEG